MTLEEAHKKIDEEYAKNEEVTVGFRKGRVPSSTRVAMALMRVSEMAQSESAFFSLPRKENGNDE